MRIQAYTVWSGNDFISLMQGVIHPVDALATTRFSEVVNHNTMIAFVHMNAHNFFPIRHQSQTVHRFPVISSIPMYANFTYNLKYCAELVAELLDPSIHDFTSYHTAPLDGVHFVVPVLDSRKYILAEVNPTSRVTANHWKDLHKRMMKLLGASLVDVFFNHDGYIPHFMNNEEELLDHGLDMRLCGDRRYDIPWLSFFLHPFFREFMPKMRDQPRSVLSRAITNVTYGAVGNDGFFPEMDFQFNVRETRSPQHVVNQSILDDGLQSSVFVSVSTQEVYNQKIIRATFREYLQMELMQVCTVFQ